MAEYSPETQDKQNQQVAPENQTAQWRSSHFSRVSSKALAQYLVDKGVFGSLEEALYTPTSVDREKTKQRRTRYNHSAPKRWRRPIAKAK